MGDGENGGGLRRYVHGVWSKERERERSGEGERGRGEGRGRPKGVGSRGV